MKSLLKRSAIVLPALLIGSAATLGMYAHASTNTPVSATAPTQQQAVVSKTSSESAPEAVDGDNIQSGAQGPDVQGSKQADTAESSVSESANDPAGGPNDQVQVGDQSQGSDAVDAPDTGTQGGVN